MLKKYLLAISLTVLSSSLMAEEMASNSMENEEYCEAISRLSEGIMKSRQAGVSLSDSLGIAQTEVTRMIVLDAWESPRYSTKSVIQREVDDFRDKWHLGCLKAISE